MFRFFSCLFGKTPEERNQEKQIQALNKTINKQKQLIDKLKNNKSNNDWKIEDLEKQLKDKQELLTKQGNKEEEVYLEELRKSARRHYAKANGLKFHEDNNTDGDSVIDISDDEEIRREGEKPTKKSREEMFRNE